MSTVGLGFFAGGLKIWVIQKVFVTPGLCFVFFFFLLHCLPSSGHHQFTVATGADGTQHCSLIYTGRSGPGDVVDLIA